MRMYDPSKYVPDSRELAMQGNDLQLKSAISNTQNMSRDFAAMNELAAQKRRDKMQLQAAMAQLAERQASRKSLEQRFGENLGFRRDKLAQDQGNVMYDRDQKQRMTDADLVAGLVGPAASGNLNALEEARARAAARDPSLSVQLPGEMSEAVPDTANSMTFTPDEVYPEDVSKLRVSRGDTRIYTSPEAREMRAREAEVADLLGPNSGPWSARSVSAAGAGVTGEKAAEIGRAEQNRLEGRETAERVAGSRMGQQRALAERKHELEMPLQVQDRVDKMTQSFMPQVQKINESDRAFALAERQLDGDANAFMQNKAMAGILKAYTGAAATDAERKQDAQAAGKWNYYDKLIGTWMEGGELPPDFREQVQSMVADARAENVRQRHALGEQARDSVYSAPGLPMSSAREAAQYGAYAYTRLTGQKLTAGDIEREAKSIESDFSRRRGGARATSPMRAAPPALSGTPSSDLPEDAFVPPNDTGDMGGFQGGSGARNALPVPDVPRRPPLVPQAAPSKDDEGDELLDEFQRQLEALDGRP